MEPAEYARMNALEERMWWYRGVHANVLAAFERHGAALAGPGLDAGCGTGGLLRRLAAAAAGRTLIGIDVDAGACALARAKAGVPVAQASTAVLPFCDASLAVVFSVDVLCHEAVPEAEALAEIRRCLVPGGVLVMNLPAYEWMKSAHDARVRNARRYTRAGARLLLERAGFRILRATYWNTLLFPLMAMRRLVLRRVEGESDVQAFPGVVDRAFGALLACERRWLGLGLDLPFGGSLLTVAAKR